MRRTTQLRALFVALALFALQFAAHAQSTTWTGAVSTDWNNSANWSAGLPSATRDAVIGPATRGCVVPVTTTPVPVRDLTVQTGASFSVPNLARVQLTGNLDYGSTISGTGIVEMVGGAVFSATRSVRGRNGSTLHTLNVSNISNLNVLQITDITIRLDLIADTLARLEMFGRNEIVGRFSFRAPPGLTTCQCEPSGTLIVGFLDTLHSVFVPSNFLAGRIYVPFSSAITPSAGSIVFPSGTTTRIEARGGYIGPAHVQAGATVRYEGSGTIGRFNCEGTLLIEPTSTGVVMTDLSVAGEVRFLGPNTNPSGPGDTRFSLSLAIAPGGRLVFDPQSALIVSTPPSVQVAGTLEVGAGVYFGTSALSVASTGSLRLIGTASQPASLGCSSVLPILGEFAGSHFIASTAGIQLLAGSRIGAAPNNLVEGRFMATGTTQASPLLEIRRVEPTSLQSVSFEAINGAQVRNILAATPHPVSIRNASGNRAGAAFEDDPLGVISWSNGVTYAGAATPGCLGLAECETTGDARLGNASFAFRCRRAHPSGAAIFLHGWGSATMPYPFANLSLWFDPALPLTSVFRTADATGTVLSPLPLPANPAFAGLTFTGQFVLFEPPGCTPTNLSASTAARMVLQL